MDKVVDIIIPLRDGGSEHGDLEVRYLLRSLCANAKGVGRVIVVSAFRPAWLRDDGMDSAFVSCSDVFRHNKDGNIFRKVLAGLSEAATEEVVWTCDDCAALKSVDMAHLPVSHSLDGAGSKIWNAKSQWTKRMRNTFEYVHGRTGRWLAYMYDSHLPQRLDRVAAIKAIEDCRHLWAVENAGLCINTAIVPFAMPYGERGVSVAWGHLKTSYETGRNTQTLGDKHFVSYNDYGWNAGVSKLLEKRFPSPCMYEKA